MGTLLRGLLQNMFDVVAKPGSPAVGWEGWEEAGRLGIHTPDEKKRNEEGGNRMMLMPLLGLRTRHKRC